MSHTEQLRNLMNLMESIEAGESISKEEPTKEELSALEIGNELGEIFTDANLEEGWKKGLAAAALAGAAALASGGASASQASLEAATNLGRCFGVVAQMQSNPEIQSKVVNRMDPQSRQALYRAEVQTVSKTSHIVDKLPGNIVANHRAYENAKSEGHDMVKFLVSKGNYGKAVEISQNCMRAILR